MILFSVIPVWPKMRAQCTSEDGEEDEVCSKENTNKLHLPHRLHWYIVHAF
jgi:hypothetical protein